MSKRKLEQVYIIRYIHEVQGRKLHKSVALISRYAAKAKEEKLRLSKNNTVMGEVEVVPVEV